MSHKGIALFCGLNRVLLQQRETAAQETIDALERYTQAGGKFGVIADYSPHTVHHCLRHVPVNTWSVILNGAEAYRFDTRTVAFPRVISQLGMAAFLRQVKENMPDVSILLYSESRLFCLSDPMMLTSRFIHGNPPFDVVGLETALRFPWLGVRFFGCKADLDTLELGAARWGLYDLADCVHDDPGTVVFVPHRASKGRCLGDLRCLDELRDKKIVVIGSEAGDEGMMEQADVAIATADAPAAVQAAATYHIPASEGNPLRYVIDRLLATLPK